MLKVRIKLCSVSCHMITGAMKSTPLAPQEVLLGLVTRAIQVKSVAIYIQRFQLNGMWKEIRLKQ